MKTSIFSISRLACNIMAQLFFSFSTPLPTHDSRCIITIDGRIYDISVFRHRHEGGDIFRCRLDMSDKFHNKRPTTFLNVLQLSKFD